ncbi:hypothetical protein CsSME_00035533 [Camellia sinensis var. sinensis]
MSYQAGQAKDQAQQKGNQMMDKASNATQSAKESLQESRICTKHGQKMAFRGAKIQNSPRTIV